MGSQVTETKQPSFQDSKKWSDRFIPEIQKILGMTLINYANEKEDMYHNTDLIVITKGSVRIACRIRRFKYLEKYGNEFTIRKSRPSGNKSELEKIKEGWGDYLFYGFCNEEETSLLKWSLCSLAIFRGHYESVEKSAIRNLDRSSDFIPFSFSDFPEAFVMSQSF